MQDMPSKEKIDLPKISIGIIVYNGVEHIRGALDSVVSQSYKDIELIVVDGGSTDGTLDVLHDYAGHISVLVSAPDKGIYDAMNKVCSLATGDWLIFLGCDDVLLNIICDVAASLNQSDAIYYGDAIFRSNDRVIGGEFSKYRLMKSNICHQAVFYPMTVYKKYSYSLDYKWLADYAYNIRLFGEGIQFVYLGIVVSIYNDKGGSSLGDAVFEKNKLRLIRESLGTAYALLEILSRLADKAAITIGVVMKCLLPDSCWRYWQSLWRRFRQTY